MFVVTEVDGTSSDVANASHGLKDKVRHLEEINQKLSTDLEQTHAADREKARLLEQHHTELQQLQQETSQVCN